MAEVILLTFVHDDQGIDQVWLHEGVLRFFHRSIDETFGDIEALNQVCSFFYIRADER